jgi:hypothetical protein
MMTSDSPTITLIFKGIFLLAFEEENKFCQAGVMRAENHCLKINIKANETSQPISPELPSLISDGDIFFQVSGRSSGVSVYERPGPLVRNIAPDWRDFRWVLDMEGGALYNRPLPFKAGVLKQSIFINNGQFYTYSTQSVLIISPSSSQRNAIVAEQIGCDIYLDDQEEAVLRYGPGLGHSIKFKKEPGISYVISLENFCEEPPRLTPDNSDFVFYYDVIDVPRNAQFRLTRRTADARNPCVPTTAGLTKAPLS